MWTIKAKVIAVAAGLATALVGGTALLHKERKAASASTSGSKDSPFLLDDNGNVVFQNDPNVGNGIPTGSSAAVPGNAGAFTPDDMSRMSGPPAPGVTPVAGSIFGEQMGVVSIRGRS